MNVKSPFALAVAVFAVAGCGSNPRDETSKDPYGLASQPQIYLIHQTARKTFLIESAGYRATAGPISVVLQIYESARMQQRFDLQDPINFGKERLGESLRRELALANVQLIAGVSDLPVLAEEAVDKPQEWQRTSPGGTNQEASDATRKAAMAAADTFSKRYPSGVAIQMVTQHWGIDNYKMKYYASVRVIDLARSKVLVSTNCPWVIFDQVDAKDLPPESAYDAYGKYNPNALADRTDRLEEILYANNGELIKASLRKAAEVCAERINARLFGRRPDTKL